MIIQLIVLIFYICYLCGASSSIKCANDSTFDADLDAKFRKDYSHGWAVRHPTLANLYNDFHCKVCIEIGIARGELSQVLLKMVPGITDYHAIDPFLGNYDNSNDAMSQVLAEANAPDKWANAVIHTMKDYGCKFKLHQGLSSDMVKDFTPASVDCAFIDGDHRYEGVKSDIKLYTLVVKPGGLLIFDDYSWQFMGVVKAVDELVDQNHLDFVKINKHNNYYVKLPDTPDACAALIL